MIPLRRRPGRTLKCTITLYLGESVPRGVLLGADAGMPLTLVELTATGAVRITDPSGTTFTTNATVHQGQSGVDLRILAGPSGIQVKIAETEELAPVAMDFSAVTETYFGYRPDGLRSDAIGVLIWEKD